MPILEAAHLRKEFGTLVAVKDISFSADKGQVVGLVGPNGAGKTTLLKMLATALEPTDGTAKLLGLDIKTDYLKIRQSIGYMPDFFNLYDDLTIEECLSFFAKAYGVSQSEIPARIMSVLKHTNLEDKKSSFIKNLSRGMIQRLGLGVLLVHSPEIFILDEPASGLDPKARNDLRSTLKHLSADGKTIIISSHILTELSGLCTHIAIMDKGEILQYGEVDDIERNISAAKTVCITVLKDCDVAIELIKKLDDLQVVHVQNNTLRVEIGEHPETVAKLNKHLVENGIDVVSLYQEKSTLEDVYLKIAGVDRAQIQ